MKYHSIRFKLLSLVIVTTIGIFLMLGTLIYSIITDDIVKSLTWETKELNKGLQSEIQESLKWRDDLEEVASTLSGLMAYKVHETQGLLSIALIDTNKKILATSEHQFLYKMLQDSALTNHLTNNELTLDTKSSYTSIIPIFYKKAVKGYFINRYSSQSIVSRAISKMLPLGAAFIVGILLLAVTIVLFIERTLVQPLYALNQTIQKITKTGKLVKHSHFSFHDEIRELSQFFNKMIDVIELGQTKMVDRLETHQQESKKKHSTMEKNIKLQEDEIRGINQRLMKLSEIQEDVVVMLTSQMAPEKTRVTTKPSYSKALSPKLYAQSHHYLDQLETTANQLKQVSPELLTMQQQWELFQKEIKEGKPINYRAFKRIDFDVKYLKVLPLKFKLGQTIKTIVYDRNFVEALGLQALFKTNNGNETYDILEIRTDTDNLQCDEADLILIDLSITDNPEHSLELVQHLNILYPEKPIIVVSSHVAPEIVFTALSVGARAYISKFDNLKDFTHQLDRVLFHDELIIGGASASNFLTLFRLRERLDPVQAMYMIRSLWGKTVTEIKAEFGVSSPSVSKCLKNAAIKLGIDSGDIKKLKALFHGSLH